jgi:hypothetical protein
MNKFSFTLLVAGLALSAANAFAEGDLPENVSIQLKDELVLSHADQAGSLATYYFKDGKNVLLSRDEIQKRLNYFDPAHLETYCWLTVALDNSALDARSVPVFVVGSQVLAAERPQVISQASSDDSKNLDAIKVIHFGYALGAMDPMFGDVNGPVVSRADGRRSDSRLTAIGCTGPDLKMHDLLSALSGSIR